MNSVDIGTKTSHSLKLAFEIITLFAVFFGSPLAASREISSLKPSWSCSTSSASLYLPNESFLANRQEGMQESDVQKSLIDPDTALVMRKQYEDMVNNYEQLEHRNLLTPEAQRAHAQQMADFSKNVINEVRRYRIRKTTDKAREVAERDENLSKARAPIAIAATLVGIYQGAPMNLNLSERTQLTARSDVRSQRGQLTLVSPAVNSSFDYVAGAPEARDPAVPPPSDDPVKGEEKYKFGVSRGLPFFGLNTGFSYGTSTKTMTASLSKQVTDNVRVVLDSIHPTQTSQTTFRGEDKFSLLYGLTF